MFEKSALGNTIDFKVGIWHDRKSGMFELRSKPDGRHLITALRNDPSLERGHLHLLKQLAKRPGT